MTHQQRALLLKTHIPMDKKTPWKLIYLFSLAGIAYLKIEWFGGGFNYGYAFFFAAFIYLFIWLEKKGRKLVIIDIPTGTDVREIVDGLCEKYGWSIKNIEYESEKVFEVLEDKMTLFSNGQTITFIDSPEGLLVNSRVKDGFVSIGGDYISKVRAYINEYTSK